MWTQHWNSDPSCGNQDCHLQVSPTWKEETNMRLFGESEDRLQKALCAACPAPDSGSVGWKELPVALLRLVLICLGLGFISVSVDSNGFLQQAEYHPWGLPLRITCLLTSTGASDLHLPWYFLFDCDWSWLLGRTALLKTDLATDVTKILRILGWL